MNFSPITSLALLAGLLLLGLGRRSWLFAAWVICLLVFPTFRLNFSGAPVYFYDLLTLLALLFLGLAGRLNGWPRGVPRWHLWFIGLAFVLSVLFGTTRHGWSPLLLWIWGHTSLAWLAFALGVLAAFTEEGEVFRRGLETGLLVSLAALSAMAVIQYAELPGCEALTTLLYGDLGNEEAVEALRRGLETNRAMGPHFAPTTFAGMAVLSAMGLWLLAGPAGRKRWGLGAALAGGILLCTVSRHALLAVAAGGLAMLLLSRTSWITKSACLLGLGAALAGATAAGVFLQGGWGSRLSKWEDGLLEDDNTAARVVWGPARLARFLVREPWLLVSGNGLDPEKFVARSQQETEFESGFVSNGFLLQLYYLGVPGFLLHGLFWAWALGLAWRFPDAWQPARVGCVVTAVLIVAADNYSVVYEPAVALLFLLVGLLAGESHRVSQMETEEDPVPETAEERYAA